jgi:hypothetical protein
MMDIPDDYEALLEERGRLILKKFSSQSLTDAEKRRLDHLSQQLEAIEYEELADDLARLDAMVSRTERLAQCVTEAVAKFKPKLGTPPNGKR